ncbi:MAG: flagellar motor protein MotB [Planctomycetota bacterium]|jgi:flagellar motor protein MotB
MSKRPEEKKPGVPAYIVTFSDMITLLLTFFVMLLSMAQTQVDKHKFMAGCTSFKKAVADFGMNGFLISRNSGPEMEHPKPKYRVEEGEDEKENRSIDSETENVRRILMEVERMMKISPSQIAGMDKNFLQTDIRFAPNSGQLDRNSQKKIIKLFEQIKINYAMQDPIIYVLGLAGDVKDPQQQWIISAKRADAVADYIKTQLGRENKWPVFSWGSGNGGQWTGYKGQVTKNAHIMITVMTETK